MLNIFFYYFFIWFLFVWDQQRVGLFLIFLILTIFYIILYFLLAGKKIFASAKLHSLVAYVLVLWVIRDRVRQCLQQTVVGMCRPIWRFTLHLLASFINKVVICESKRCRFKVRLSIIFRLNTIAAWTASVIIWIWSKFFFDISFECCFWLFNHPVVARCISKSCLTFDCWAYPLVLYESLLGTAWRYWDVLRWYFVACDTINPFIRRWLSADAVFKMRWAFVASIVYSSGLCHWLRLVTYRLIYTNSTDWRFRPYAFYQLALLHASLSVA